MKNALEILNQIMFQFDTELLALDHDAMESKRLAPNSYGCGYDTGCYERMKYNLEIIRNLIAEASANPRGEAAQPSKETTS